MSKGVFIVGLGAISAIGNDLRECISALENGRTGIDAITRLQTTHRGRIPVAEVKLTNAELANRAAASPRVSRTALLSLLAAREALDDAALPERSDLRIGFISANTVGGMDRSEQFFEVWLADPSHAKLRGIVQHECGAVTEWVADQLGIGDYVTTISTACSSSANAIFFGARLIRQGLLDVAVAGGADALTKFTLNGFNSLMILDGEPCKPFDEDRNGLNLGEGSGYLVLVSERLASAVMNGSEHGKIYCRLSGWANANDAYHQTASSPDGTGSYLAMQGALERSGLCPSDISYINLHGTGTRNNDMAEGIAIRRLFGTQCPKMSSTKSFTGHTLGASGGIEAVFSALSVKYGFIYPNLRFRTPMDGFSCLPETTFSCDPAVAHVLSNSFGFGGNCSSLIFSKL
ncbi:MAG: beta-ketoacyl-[acyl-carrier-protein] synthase family protein [Bacteroidota bacterium]|nr:beta-ketoacyl-[acyl-carrier-protein] synthase family protein [Bacteroidota bacterium]MDP4217663.1 beta-ketoacyl-[acyl-carrier-protein] synthase family protein [Bacteroidota bacterium]MDP4245134.1 beta-ketoacyl-[acyl-carrier-protein] synthase family protein [Bacteroidota bacterium]MDP4256795.1 beta-ketoacyl-[acyl-carrier-protein] synthase family protein [Bacteroidota bacterium]